MSRLDICRAANNNHADDEGDMDDNEQTKLA